MRSTYVPPTKSFLLLRRHPYFPSSFALARLVQYYNQPLLVSPIQYTSLDVNLLKQGKIEKGTLLRPIVTKYVIKCQNSYLLRAPALHGSQDKILPFYTIYWKGLTRSNSKILFH